MSDYSEFAFVYDRLMSDVDYKARADYLLKLFLKFDRKPALLLDVACGTGAFSNEFADMGMEVIGADPSAEMLSVARENTADRGNSILFLCQKAEELDLYGTVDGAVCCLDSLNHITDYNDLCRAVSRVSLFLEKDRLFIFDVNTPFKHKTVLADNIFIKEQEGVYCVWQNDTDQTTLTTNIMLDFFVEEDGVYIRSGTEFSERAYTMEEIKDACILAGLKIEAVFEDMTEQKLQTESERAVFITRKIK